MTTEISRPEGAAGVIPDSPNAWDSGRYDWPASAPAAVPQPAQPLAVPAPVLQKKGAIWLFHVAVGALAIVSVISVIAIWALASNERTVPGELTTLAATALGGLVAMVATQQSGGGNG